MRILAATGPVAPNLALVMSILAPLRIRIRVLVVAACVTIKEKPVLLLLRHNKQTINNGQLDFPASANTLSGSYRCRVVLMKYANGILVMGKKYKNLIEDIVSIENMRRALHKTKKGKAKSYGYLEFREYEELNLKILADEMKSGYYKRGYYNNFYIYEPKKRLISALPFRDRVAQHAINNIIEAIFDVTFLPYTFACRKGKGTHAGVKYVQSEIRKQGRGYFLKCDIKSYFPNIDKNILYNEINKKIYCKDTQDLILSIISNEGKGIPIGSLLSQLFANLYGSMLDYFIHYELKPVTWARYMDDFILLDEDSSKLRKYKYQIEDFINEKMKMEFSKWSISPVSRGINFLGYRIWPYHKLIRKQSVRDAKRKIKHYRQNNEYDKLYNFLGSWIGHINWADSYNLKKSLEVSK